MVLVLVDISSWPPFFMHRKPVETKEKRGRAREQAPYIDGCP